VEGEPLPEPTITRATTKFSIRLDALSENLNRARKKGQKRARSLAEDEAREALIVASRYATTAQNVGMRLLYRADSDVLDAFMAEHGRLPIPGEVIWPSAKAYRADSPVYVYRRMVMAVPELSSSIAATLSKKVVEKWASERVDTLVRQQRSAPHYRLGGPLPIPAQVTQWTWDPSSKRAMVDVTLFSTKKRKGVHRVTIPVEARDDRQAKELEMLALGDGNPAVGWRPGEVTIQRDRLRPQKWFLRCAYTRVAVARKEGVAAAINLGMRCLLAFYVEGGPSDIYEARDIEAYLRGIQRRRRDRQNVYRWTDGSRRGHGRPRALQSIEVLAERAANYRKTRMQTLARRFARRLVEMGVNVLYVQKFDGIRDALPELLMASMPRSQWIWERIQEWPYSEMQARIVTCCQDEGIRCVEMAAQYNSQRCPVCGFVSKDLRDLVNWRLKHAGCINRHLDVGHAMNAIARGAATDPDGSRKIKGLAEWNLNLDETARETSGKKAKEKGNGETGGDG
jgi:hypothetical protein